MHAQVGNINIYNVFGECISGSVQEKAGRSVLKAPRKDAPWAKGATGPNACIDSIAATAWINQPEVTSLSESHDPGMSSSVLVRTRSVLCAPA